MFTAVRHVFILGAFRPLKKTHPDADLVKKTFGVSVLDEIYEAERILKNGQRYFSKLYKRMIKRICHVVLLNDRTVGAVQYFLFDKRTMMVYATITQFHVGTVSFLHRITGGKHLTSVKLMDSGSKAIVPVDTLAESLFFIDPHPTNTYSCVSRVSHCHGRSVFK